MFDFDKLDVYKKAKTFNANIRAFISSTKLDRVTNDQLRRAAFSVVLNLAEGSDQNERPLRFLERISKMYFCAQKTSEVGFWRVVNS